MSFQKAIKSRVHLRAGIAGPSGSGKTYSALRVATGLGGTLGVIDTEHRRSQLYADDFSFIVMNLEDHSIDSYVGAIDAAAKAGVTTLVIDSTSHEWLYVLEQVDKTAQTKFRGNSWSAWSVWTPLHRAFMEKILHYPGHLLATFRVDTEWSQETDRHTGKTKPVKIGLKPQTGKGAEYDFDFFLELTQEHQATITKGPRLFQDRIIEKPGEDFGRELAAWLSDGVAPAEPAARPLLEDIRAKIKQHDIDDRVVMGWCAHYGVSGIADLQDDQLRNIIVKVVAKYETNEPTLVA